MYTKSIFVAALVGLATTSPIEVRQFGGLGSLGGLSGFGGLSALGGGGGGGSSSSEFSQGGCRDILFAFARGSTEIGNMVCMNPGLSTH